MSRLAGNPVTYGGARWPRECRRPCCRPCCAASSATAATTAANATATATDRRHAAQEVPSQLICIIVVSVRGARPHGGGGADGGLRGPQGTPSKIKKSSDFGHYFLEGAPFYEQKKNRNFFEKSLL